MARLLKKPWHVAFYECVSPHTDTPDQYIIWSALSLIGAVLKDNVRFEIGTYILYPNQFIVLVGPPGVGKGTAMNIISDIIKEDKLNPLVNTLSDRITAEKIIEQIATGWSSAPIFKNQQLVMSSADHNCLIFSSEIRVLLGASEWMLEFLEEAWSRTTFEYQTKTKGSVSIDSMCCSLLAASVPDFLRNVNKEARMVITGGFSSRCLFIYADAPSKDLPFPIALKKSPKSKALYDDLVADLRDIATMRGEFTIASDARILFENFLKQNRIAGQKDDSEAIANFRARIKAHTLKLAMVLSASRSSSLVIDQLDMANAIHEIQRITQTLEKLFRGAGDSMDSENVARVQAYIEKQGMASKQELLRALWRHFGSETLDRILTLLVTIEFCTVISQNKTTYYKHIPKLQNGRTRP